MSEDRGEALSAFRAVPRTGVIYVTTEAMRAGYHPGDERWCNLGQGQPETGPLPGAPPLGVMGDLFVFLWAEIAAVIALGLVVIMWAWRGPSP